MGNHVLLPPVVTQVTDINIESSCSKPVDPYMALCSILGMDITMASVAGQVMQINMVLLETWLLIPIWPQVTEQTPGIFIALGGKEP